MGTRTLMSTLGAIPPIPCARQSDSRMARWLKFSQSSLFISVFSVKLSPVTTHSEDPIRIEPPPTPVPGELPAALPEPHEVGGRGGPEPTRYGDWELRGR